MKQTYFVRVGLFGNVGRFQPLDAARYRRGSRVVCRTHRGLEVGELLSPIAGDGEYPIDGEIVRAMTVEDHLMFSRLERDKTAAIHRCSELLTNRGSQAVILDAEILLDGGGLYFYFLGDTSGELAALTDELATVYQAEVQFQQFADTLIHGCGPDCGTEVGGGCGDSCGSCAVASACKTSVLPHKA